MLKLFPYEPYDVVTKKGLVTRTAPKGGKNIKERTFIGRLIQDYYYVDGEALGEKNPKWLQDDYVKFIRYGQHRIAQTGAGILAFITNHGYLDNPTFRGMRQQLMKTFSEIYVLDLHGNAKKKEVCPDGSEDKNVFDIQQGVSIGIFVKTPEADGAGAVFHAELWGTRKQKYQWLFENEITSTQWDTVEPETPFYLFKPQDKERVTEYGKFLKMTDLMQTNVLGFQTHRDHFAVAIDEKQLRGRFEEMRNEGISDHEFAAKYTLKDNRDWKLAKAREQLRKMKDWVSVIIRCAYRPFDDRWCCFSDIAMDYPRRELMDHVAGKGNICLGLGRQGIAVNDPVWSLIQVCRIPIDANIFRRGGINVFPLYLYPQDETEKGRQRTFRGGHGNWERGEGGRVPNLDKGFVDGFSERVGLGFVSDGRGDVLSVEEGDRKGRPYKAGGAKTFGPEDLFDYIYGVFHSPAYRRRYAEFLKIDFPRVPLPRDCALFRSVARLGGELVGLHLMESDVLDEEGRGPDFDVEGDMTVAKGYPKYDVGEGRVYINEKQYFAGVVEAVWDFHVGGYQVCGKWLKDRRGRVLSYDDVSHYQRIVVALGETIRIMGEIDEAIDGLGGWPIDE